MNRKELRTARDVWANTDHNYIPIAPRKKQTVDVLAYLGYLLMVAIAYGLFKHFYL